MDNKHIITFIILVVIILSASACPKSTSNDVNHDSSFDRKDIGMNIIDSENNIKNIPVFNQRKVFTLEDILEEKIKNAIVMGALGEIKPIEEYGCFESNESSIDYINKDGQIIVKEAIGVIVNPPMNSIMNSYYDMLSFLEEGEDVLFILLDGFGYHQYQYAFENGFLPFLGKQPKINKALSVYKPVTNAGLAAIITGKSPAENGVHSRKQRELETDSIFKVVEDLDKKALYIEGNIGILKTEIEPVLNLDNNGDGFTDDEVYKSTMEAMGKDYNLVFTHFHGIDDSGHTYGDLSLETMEFIKRVDAYVEEIASKWKGKIIITADHGMHSTEYGGDHGEFRYEDMVVPYIIMDGGNQFE